MKTHYFIFPYKNQFLKMDSDATVVLIVEKDTVFQRLVDQNAVRFLARNGLKAIIVTGKGESTSSGKYTFHSKREKKNIVKEN